jgi:hypothetical protein
MRTQMSEKGKKASNGNRVNLRITDKAVLDLLADLYAAPAFKTKTEVLNGALYLGVAELYTQTFGKKKAQEEARTESGNAPTGDALKSVRITLDQNAVTLNICEKLVTALYNLEAAKADGIEITPELLTSGVLDRLPAHLEAEKQAMMKAEFLKRRRK